MSIKRIDANSVHWICSGQVITDLSSAVKELIENSLDAGATQISVVLKDSGFDQIEVSDNGSGIHESDFDLIGQKHATSKMKHFSDISSLTTFGFRGEAVSSLCAVSDVRINTRHITAKNGTMIKLTNDGRISSKSVVPRGVF
jgi:DNA mismatch repair protein PMS2